MTPKPNTHAPAVRRSRLLVLTFFLSAIEPAGAIEPFEPEQTAYYLCAGCHGPEPGSVLYPMPPDIPALVGQRKDYLLKQLKAYRDGQRKHPNMSGPLTNYSDENLAALAAYYEALGPARPAKKSPRPAPVVQPPAPTGAPPLKSSTKPARHKKGHSSTTHPTPKTEQ